MDDIHSHLTVGNTQSEISSSRSCSSATTRCKASAPATATDVTGAGGATLYVHRLNHGRSTKLVLEVVPDSTGLYRIAWPDIGLSETANLTRCKQAALEWAEQRFMAEHRNLCAARRLKSLNNFWWSTSLVRQNQNSDQCTDGEWITCSLEGAPRC